LTYIHNFSKLEIMKKLALISGIVLFLGVTAIIIYSGIEPKNTQKKPAITKKITRTPASPRQKIVLKDSQSKLKINKSKANLPAQPDKKTNIDKYSSIRKLLLFPDIYHNAAVQNSLNNILKQSPFDCAAIFLFLELKPDINISTFNKYMTILESNPDFKNEFLYLKAKYLFTKKEIDTAYYTLKKINSSSPFLNQCINRLKLELLIALDLYNQAIAHIYKHNISPTNPEPLVKTLIKEKKYKLAEKLLNKLLENKKTLQFYLLKLDILYKRNRFSKALALASSLITTFKSEALYLKMADILFALNKYKKALSFYTKAYELNKNSSVAALEIASCYLSLGEIKKALNYFKNIESQPHDSCRYYTVKASAYLAIQNYPEAIKNFKIALALNKSPEILFELCKALLLSNNLTEYKIKLKELKLYKKKKFITYLKALESFKNCNYENSIKLLKPLLNNTASFETVILYLECLKETNNFKQLFEEAKKYRKLFPSEKLTEFLLFAKGKVLSRDIASPETSEFFKKLKADIKKIRFLISINQIDAAFKKTVSILKLYKGNPELNLLYVNLLERKQDYKAAAKLLKKLKNKLKNSPELDIYLAKLLNYFDKAEALLIVNKYKSSNNPEVCGGIGDIYFYNKEYEKAFEFYTKAKDSVFKPYRIEHYFKTLIFLDKTALLSQYISKLLTPSYLTYLTEIYFTALKLKKEKCISIIKKAVLKKLKLQSTPAHLII